MTTSADRVALVTGGSGALGGGIISALSTTAVVIAGSRNRPERGNHDHFISVDTTNADQVQDTIREVQDTYGRLDILVNNAGATTPRADLDALDLDEWRRVVDVNLNGTYHMLRAAGTLLRRSPAGRVVNITSVMGLQPMPRMVAYATSKSALVGLTAAAARELAPSCTVNAIAPGYMDDGLAVAVLADDAYREFVMERTPAKRVGTSAELGALTRFLCSEDAGFITGQIIALDGGWTLV